MDATLEATFVAGRGIAGNADQGGRRQVTLIDRQGWDAATEELGTPVDPSLRRANLLISGLTLAESRGRVLRVGPVRLRINGETRPCEVMDRAWPGLRKALSAPWRGGAFAEVLDDGHLKVGDSAEWAGDPGGAT
jgi:MOSC domain-containing protein YiiM